MNLTDFQEAERNYQSFLCLFVTDIGHSHNTPSCKLSALAAYLTALQSGRIDNDFYQSGRRARRMAGHFWRGIGWYGRRVTGLGLSTESPPRARGLALCNVA